MLDDEPLPNLYRKTIMITNDYGERYKKGANAENAFCGESGSWRSPNHILSFLRSSSTEESRILIDLGETRIAL